MPSSSFSLLGGVYRQLDHECSPPYSADTGPAVAAQPVESRGASAPALESCGCVSENLGSCTRALRAASFHVARLGSSVSAKTSRTASLIISRILSLRNQYTSSATIPLARASTNQLCSTTTMTAPVVCSHSATPLCLRRLARQHANSQAWREIAEFFEPVYIARLREIGSWCDGPAGGSVTALAPVRDDERAQQHQRIPSSLAGVRA
mgnify:CR=1 FL=1